MPRGYRPDVDGLRAVAVLAVITFHAFPEWSRGGFVGVDIFFVVSGFLISSLILERLRAGSFSLATFYGRRIRRLFPALVLVLAACYAFGWFTLLTHEYKQLGKHIAGAAAFVPNFVLESEVGYFDNTADTKPLLHLWSLGIEEQFYLLWPALLWLAWRRRLDAAAIAVALATVSFLINVSHFKTSPATSFYAPQARIWELFAGSALAYICIPGAGAVHTLRPFGGARLVELVSGPPPDRNIAALRSVLSLVGMGLIAVALWTTERAAFPGYWALLPVVGTLLVIAAGPDAWLNRRILHAPGLVWIGLISYPLYLWHWPLLSFARIIEGDTPSSQARLSLLVIALGLAAFTYNFLERPVRRAGRAGATAMAWSVLLALVGTLGYIAAARDDPAIRKNLAEAGRGDLEFVGPMWKYAQNDICLQQNRFDPASGYAWWFCMQKEQGKPTLLLLGNSYANQFYPAFTGNPRLAHHNVLSIGTCDPAWVDESAPTIEVARNPCSGPRTLEQMHFINSVVTREKSIRFAVLGGLRATRDAAYVDGLRKRIDFLEGNGVRVILLTPLAALDYDVTGCYARPFAPPQRSCEERIDKYRTMLNDFDALKAGIQATHPRVLFFDPNALFCRDGVCRFKIDGLPAFRDQSQHLSERAAVRLGGLLAEWAVANAPDLLK